MHNDSLFRLLQLADTALPVGGYAHSAGLETYVQKGLVNSLDTSKAFITHMLERNIRYTDATFVSLAFDAAVQNNWPLVPGLDAECNAVKLPKEIREASRKLGSRLLKLFHPVCANPFLEQYIAAIAGGEAGGHYSIAFGMLAAALQIDKEAALAGFCYNAAAGMVTNCVKLIPLGQQEGQEMLFSLQPVLAAVVRYALHPDPSRTGLSCTGFDIRSMQHEQLYSRLYMS